MPTRRCCCDIGSCLIGTDDFNRVDANPPSGNWEVVDGEWEVVDDTLVCISEGPVITTHRQPAPLVVGAKYATNTGVRLVNVPENGTKEYGIICGFMDIDNFDWIKLIWRGADHSTDPNTLEPIFYRRTGGSDTIIMDSTTNPQNALGIEPYFSGIGTVTSIFVGYCYSSLEWSIGVSEPALEDSWTVCDGGLDAMPSIPYGTTGFLLGDFDDWTHSQHFESRADCFGCGCACAASNTDRKCWPDEMLLTAIAGPGAPYPDDPPCEGDISGIWDIEVLLHRCSAPVANYADYPGISPVYPLDTDRNIWYSDPFISQGVYYWFIVTCGTNDGETTLFVAINVYGDQDPYGQSVDSVTTPPSGGHLAFSRVNPGPNPSPPGYAIPHIGGFTCDPLFLNYLAGFAGGDTLDNAISSSPPCDGPQYWHTLTITDAP